jgi:HipA-like protein
MTGRTLDVWCFDEHAGVLTDGAAGLDFAYSDTWLAAGRPPLSQSLALDGSYSGASVGAFFGGLLPEDAPRGVLARNLGVSVGNDFGLLEALGGDTAGAMSLLSPSESTGSWERRAWARPRRGGGYVVWRKALRWPHATRARHWSPAGGTLRCSPAWSRSSIAARSG